MIDHQNKAALVSAMMSYSEQQFIRSLRMEPEHRNMQVSSHKYRLNFHKKT